MVNNDDKSRLYFLLHNILTSTLLLVICFFTLSFTFYLLFIPRVRFHIVSECRMYCGFKLPSEIIPTRIDKFMSELSNVVNSC